MNENLKVYYKMIFMFFIAVQVIINSQFQYILPSAFTSNISHMFVLLLIALALTNIFSEKHTLLFLMWISVLAAMPLLFLNNLNVSLICVTALYLIHINNDERVKIFQLGVFLGVMMVVLLSLMNSISIYNYAGESLSLGFKNENTTGYYFSFLALFALRSTKYKFLKYAPTLVAVYCNIYLFDDWTAVYMIGVFYIVRILVSVFAKQIKILLIPLSLIFTISAWFLAINYVPEGAFESINEAITYRPSIWNQYVSSNHLSLLGGLTGTELGAFDGVYVYYPLVNGLLISVLVLAGLMLLTADLIKKKNWYLVSLIVSLEFAAFTESIAFSSYQSPIVALAILSVIQRVTKSKER